MAEGELHRLGVAEIGIGLRERRFRCVDVTAACLDRIERLDERYKAFLTVAPEQALESAARIDRVIERGGRLGPLSGIPFAFKDLVETKSIRTTFGSTLYEDYVPVRDAAVVSRLRRAGVVILGKTNTPEFGYGAITDNQLRGPTANPYKPSLTSGGSSGGSAVAVSLGMLPAAHGSDFAGSVRVPASFCGIVAVRPTVGRVPIAPKMPLWQNLIVDGVFARCVEDAALVLAGMCGRDERDPLSHVGARWRMPSWPEQPNRQIRIGVSADLGLAEVDSTVERVFWEAVDQIAGLFPRVERVSPDLKATRDAFRVLRGALLKDQFGDLIAKHGERLSETLHFNVGLGEGMTADQHMQAERARSVVYLKLIDLFRRVDVLVTVSAAVPPFPNADGNVHRINGRPLRDIIDWFAVETPVTITGLPAMSVPGGWTPAGLPVGIQLIARPFAETVLLRFARWIEDSLGFRHRWPEG